MGLKRKDQTSFAVFICIKKYRRGAQKATKKKNIYIYEFVDTQNENLKTEAILIGHINTLHLRTVKSCGSCVNTS